MSTEEQMQQAKSLIQQKRYDDARALLITLDDPKAELWLTRLNQMEQVKRVNILPIQPVSEKSFTAKFFLTIVLLFSGQFQGLSHWLFSAPKRRNILMLPARAV